MDSLMTIQYMLEHRFSMRSIIDAYENDLVYVHDGEPVHIITTMLMYGASLDEVLEAY